MLRECDYTSPSYPILHYPKIIRTTFAENCCHIMDGINGQNMEWFPVLSSIQVSSSKLNSEKICNEIQMASDYIKYVMYQLGIGEMAEFTLPDDISSDALNVAIHKHLEGMLLMFIRVDRLKFERSDEIIPIQIQINEYTSGYYNYTSSHPVSEILAWYEDGSNSSLMATIKSCVHNNYKAIVYNALHEAPPNDTDFRIFVNDLRIFTHPVKILTAR